VNFETDQTRFGIKFRQPLDVEPFAVKDAVSPLEVTEYAYDLTGSI
jgi:hypothetical protein